MPYYLRNPVIWFFFGVPIIAFIVVVLMVGVGLLINRIWPGSLDPKPRPEKSAPEKVKRSEYEPTAGRFFYDDFDGGGG